MFTLIFVIAFLVLVGLNMNYMESIYAFFKREMGHAYFGILADGTSMTDETIQSVINVFSRVAGYAAMLVGNALVFIVIGAVFSDQAEA